MLSDVNRTRLCFQVCPQRDAAITTGNNSFAVMWTLAQSSGHCSWNHPCPTEKAPHPNDPDASEKTSTEHSMVGKNERPFQPLRNVYHHKRSALAPALRRMIWCGARSNAKSGKSWRRNTLPWCITVAACDRWPSNDSSSLRVHERLPTHCRMVSCRRPSFSAGRRSSKL